MSLTDFHSHILPGVDDGSRSVEESITMLRIAGEQGIRRIVATPHFYPRHDDPDRFLKARELAAQRLRQEMGSNCGLPEIVLGAEVYYFRGMSESDQLERLTIGGKTCILIEMPLGPWTSEMYRELEDISLRRGLTPIVAHIDRYIRPFHTRGIPQTLRNLPVLVQANASFFADRSTQGMALRLLRSDQIHLLGSDCHNLTTRKPDLGPATRLIEKKLGTGVLQRINEYERELLDA